MAEAAREKPATMLTVQAVSLAQSPYIFFGAGNRFLKIFVRMTNPGKGRHSYVLRSTAGIYESTFDCKRTCIVCIGLAVHKGSCKAAYPFRVTYVFVSGYSSGSLGPARGTYPNKCRQRSCREENGQQHTGNHTCRAVPQ